MDSLTLTSAPLSCPCPGSSSAAASRCRGRKGVSAGRQLPVQPCSRIPAQPGQPQPGQSLRSSALQRQRHRDRSGRAHGTSERVTVSPLKGGQHEAHPPWCQQVRSQLLCSVQTTNEVTCCHQRDRQSIVRSARAEPSLVDRYRAQDYSSLQGSSSPCQPQTQTPRNLLLGTALGVLQLFPAAGRPDRHRAVTPHPCSSRDGLCAHQGPGSPTQCPSPQPSQRSWTEPGEEFCCSLLAAGEGNKARTVS